jgi:hypothetical protein
VLTSGADKPKQHPDKVEPNPNLHPAAASIVAAVAVDVHLTEDAEQGSPEDAVGTPQYQYQAPHFIAAVLLTRVSRPKRRT